MELKKRYAESDTEMEIYTEIASGDDRTEQDRIYETLQHGTGELADKTTPSAKKCSRCTLVNSILIGLLIIVISLYVCINVSKASNSKGATVTGIWTNWSVWSPCNAKCDQGFKWRMRTCTSVSPKDNCFDSNADLQKLVTTLSQKIDKLEHAQGQIQTETLQNLTNNLNETKTGGNPKLKNEKLEHAQGQIQTKVLQITNKLNETADLQKLVATLSQKNDKLELAQGQIQTKVLQNTNRLNETKMSILPIVGFNAHLYSTETFKEGDKVVYDSVVTNQGEGYDNSTGIFTAPHTGLYFFLAHYCIYGDIPVQYAIYQEDKPLTRSTQFDDNYSYGCSFVSTIAMVNKEGRVWVQPVNSTLLFRDYDRFHAFSGFLFNK